MSDCTTAAATTLQETETPTTYETEVPSTDTRPMLYTVYGRNLQLRQGSLTEGGRISTVDLLVQTSLDQLRLILKTFFTFFTKQAILMRPALE